MESFRIWVGLGISIPFTLLHLVLVGIMKVLIMCLRGLEHIIDGIRGRE